jgi:hypothetical protein
MTDPQTIRIDIVSGVEGDSVSIGDFRVAGPKPWGGGRVRQSFHARRHDLLYSVAGIGIGEVLAIGFTHDEILRLREKSGLSTSADLEAFIKSHIKATVMGELE